MVLLHWVQVLLRELSGRMSLAHWKILGHHSIVRMVEALSDSKRFWMVLSREAVMLMERMVLKVLKAVVRRWRNIGVS